MMIIVKKNAAGHNAFNDDIRILADLKQQISHKNYITSQHSDIFAMHHLNGTTHGEVMTSYRFFQDGDHRVGKLSISGVGFDDGTCLAVFKSICTPNFGEISQSTAELFLLPVCESGRLPYWNSTFGFDFDPFIVMGIPNFIQIGQCTVEL